jgi:DNA invertase Pin-like site-specific DNA recombinase
MKLGYARVSTDDQDLLMQIEALKATGVKGEHIYKEHVSGMKKDRPELVKLLQFAREGDEIIVFKMDRISRSLKHLLELTDEFEERGIHFISLHEKIDTTSANGKLFFRIMASIAEFERDLISERTKEQLAAKKKAGIKLGRPTVDEEKLKDAFALYESKRYSVKEITEKMEISRTSFYKYLKEHPVK